MPTSCLDLELSELEGLEAVPLRYESLRLLVRLHGEPLGFVHVRNPRRALDRAELAEIVAGDLHRDIWARIGSAGLTPIDPGASRRSGAATATVVVSGAGSLDELERCLTSLERQRLAPFEVLVVRAGPLDETVRGVAGAHGARYLVSSHPGVNAARNLVLAEQLGDIVVFIEPRCEPDGDWLERLADGFTSADVWATTGLVLPAELETPAQWMFEDLCGRLGNGLHPVVHCRRGRHMTFRPENYGSAASMALRRDAFVELGGFDVAFDSGAESGGALDLLQRLVERDAAIAYRPDAIVRRTHRRTVGGLESDVAEAARGRSAALRASLARADGGDRLRVTSRYLAWLWSNIRPLIRLRPRDELPRRVRRASLRAAIAGGPAYGRGRRRPSGAS